MKRYAWMVLVLVSALVVAPRARGQTVTGDVANVQSLVKAGDWAAVLAACDKAYEKYGAAVVENAHPQVPVFFFYKGWSMYHTGDVDGAAAFFKARADNPDSPRRLQACFCLSKLFWLARRPAESHQYGLLFLTLWSGRGEEEARVVAFNAVNPSLLGKEAYVSLLESLILKIPAIEENAKFLGRLKSELEKIR